MISTTCFFVEGIFKTLQIIILNVNIVVKIHFNLQSKHPVKII